MFADALAVLTWPTSVAAIIVGLFMGGVYLPEMRVRTFVGPLSVFVCGETFFLFVTVARYIDGAPTWERNIGTGILWAIFSLAMWVGLRLSLRRGGSPNA